mmetsp:Transcript_35957/g.99051  ORF Transcript_35957/g.99051 Transcript_35957/m.99051 type:complete len:354 (-) Transcript_35957:98-1159(-)
MSSRRLAPLDVAIHILCHDRALLPRHDVRRILQAADRCPITFTLRLAPHELHARFHLRPHAPREFLPCPCGVQVPRGGAAHFPCVRLAKILPNPTAVRQDDKAVGIQLVRQQRRTRVLVDHGLHASERTVCIAHGRHASTTAANHDCIRCPKQRLDLVDLKNGRRRGRGHDPPPMLAILPYLPAELGLFFFRFLFSINCPHRFGRISKCRVGGVDQCVGDDRTRALAVGGVQERRCQQVADLPLCFCTETIEWVRVHPFLCTVLLLHNGEHSHLRPIAMDEYNLVRQGELGQHRGRDRGRRLLILETQRLTSLQQRVATERHHKPLSHTRPQVSQARECAKVHRHWHAVRRET